MAKDTATPEAIFTDVGLENKGGYLRQLTPI